MVIDLFSSKKIKHLQRLGCVKMIELFHDGGHCHIETNPLICRANQWTGFCMIGTSVMKEFKARQFLSFLGKRNKSESKDFGNSNIKWKKFRQRSTGNSIVVKITT